jgi:hypothetical protein
MPKPNPFIEKSPKREKNTGYGLTVPKKYESADEKSRHDQVAAYPTLCSMRNLSATIAINSLFVGFALVTLIV